jgi:DNA replication and repair protein RecF
MTVAPADAATVRVATLTLQNFRNIESARLQLPPAGMAVIGRNGQGKTNLLEALYYLHLLRSFRGSRDADVTGFGAAGFHLRATVSGTPRGVREASVGFERQTKRKKITVDGSVPTRFSEAYGAIPAVMCSPDDRQIIAGPPAARRRYLDVMLATVSPAYLFALQQYRAALLQRNAALRATGRSGADVASLSVWEPALATHGAAIVEMRAAWAAGNASRFSRLCAAIGETAPVEIEYASATAGEDCRAALLRKLEENREVDARRGLTHAGPHREELRLRLGSRELREFASAGQQRTAALALRMVEAATMQHALGSHPLLLLDDPFAELDRERASRILSLLRDIDPGQVVLCVPRQDDIPTELSGLERWNVEGGRIASLPAAGDHVLD